MVGWREAPSGGPPLATRPAPPPPHQAHPGSQQASMSSVKGGEGRFRVHVSAGGDGDAEASASEAAAAEPSTAAAASFARRARLRLSSLLSSLGVESAAEPSFGAGEATTVYWGPGVEAEEGEDEHFLGALADPPDAAEAADDEEQEQDPAASTTWRGLEAAITEAVAEGRAPQPPQAPAPAPRSPARSLSPRQRRVVKWMLLSGGTVALLLAIASGGEAGRRRSALSCVGPP